MDVICKCIRAKCTAAAGVRTRGRGGLEGRLERKPGGEEEAGGRCGTTGQLSSGQWARGQCEENKDRNKIETAGPPGTADAGPADAGPAAERESRPAEPPGLTVSRGVPSSSSGRGRLWPSRPGGGGPGFCGEVLSKMVATI